VGDLLDRADLFVLPSVVASDGQMEGIPVALMEALACGVPAISTRLSGIPELVADGETGLLAEPGDPESLGAALKSIITGAVMLDLSRGRKIVEAEFNVGKSAKLLLALFGSANREGEEA
jgi:Glycosyltransferase